MAQTNVPDIGLTRAQISEIVGDDLRKIKVFENLIRGALIQDDVIDVDPDGNPIDPIRVTRWANGRMEMFVENPSASTGETVVFPISFVQDDTELPTVTHGMYRAAGAADDNFTVTALSLTGLTWVATTSAIHMWRAVGKWKIEQGVV